MSTILRPRYYTRHDNTIDMVVVGRTAEAWVHSHQNRSDRVARKADTLEIATAYILGLARGEQTERETDEFSRSTDFIDIQILMHFGEHPIVDSTTREAAIRAHHAGKAAVAHKSHACLHTSIAALAINLGQATLAETIPGSTETIRAYIARQPFEQGLVALNGAGAVLLASLKA